MPVLYTGGLRWNHTFKTLLKLPSVFFYFRWPFLGKIIIWQKILHLFFSHNMFRGLASCSRAGFEKNEWNISTNKECRYLLTPKSESGVKRFTGFGLKNWTPSNDNLDQYQPLMNVNPCPWSFLWILILTIKMIQIYCRLLPLRGSKPAPAEGN